jgi:putative DNA primase/helicase
MFLTNEFPRLSDASGALAGRFVILRLTQSFYGNEDTGLTERLLNELPGILNWAIEGWQRLQQRGRFVMPTSVRDVVQEIEDLSSPVSAFVRDACIIGAGHRVSGDSLALRRLEAMVRRRRPASSYDAADLRS